MKQMSHFYCSKPLNIKIFFDRSYLGGTRHLLLFTIDKRDFKGTRYEIFNISLNFYTYYFIFNIFIHIPGHPRRSKLGEIVILSLQHPYGESKQVEPIDK